MMQACGRPASVQVPRSSYLASTVRFEERSLAEVPVGKASTFRDASKSRGALRSCVIGASAIVLQLRRRIVRRALPYGDRKVDAAINIGRNANRLRQLKKTEQERKKLRLMEVRRKIEVLKGKKNRFKAPSGDREASQAEEAGSGSPDSEESSSTPSGEGPEEWAFERTARVGRRKADGPLEVSDDARAVAETELSGAGGVATSRQLLDAAIEFEAAQDFSKAGELLEMVSDRISKEQMERKLDYKVAQEYDDEACERLAGVYARSGRLTLAFNTYDILRMRVADPAMRRRAQAGWVKVAITLALKLQEAYRYQECLDLLLLVRDVAQTRVAGEKLMEEAEMYIAICLQKVGRKDEAMNVLQEVSRATVSRDRKAQAQFIMDVMNVDLPDQRNEEFHKVWEDNFNLPKDMTRSVSSGRRRPLNLNLSTQERAFRSWASEYWEERLKSPAYYFFLTLWVTWPFAIPVVSIMRRSGLLESPS